MPCSRFFTAPTAAVSFLGLSRDRCLSFLSVVLPNGHCRTRLDVFSASSAKLTLSLLPQSTVLLLATALRRRSKRHSFPAVGASASARANVVAALHRHNRCSVPLAAAASVADGAAGPAAAAACPAVSLPQAPRAPCCRGCREGIAFFSCARSSISYWATCSCDCMRYSLDAALHRSNSCIYPLTAAASVAEGAAGPPAAAAAAASLQSFRPKRHAHLAASVMGGISSFFSLARSSISYWATCPCNCMQHALDGVPSPQAPRAPCCCSCWEGVSSFLSHSRLSISY